MKTQLFKLFSRPDDSAVIYVRAINKKEAIKKINESGGYQGENFEPDYDYEIRKCKTLNQSDWSTEFILKNGQRMTFENYLLELEYNM